MSIEMPEPVKVYFKDCDFDPENPNQMSEEQELGMDNMLEKFGFVENIIVSPKDEKGRRLFHHGEHRSKRLMLKGNTWAWGVERDLSDEDHRLIRQGMNKLHGTHDTDMDAKEYQILQKAGQLKMLAILIAQPVEQLMVEKQMTAVTQDKEMIQHHEETFLQGALKQLYFIFSNEQYEALMPRIEAIIKHMKVDTNTEMFLQLVSSYEKLHKLVKKIETDNTKKKD